MFAKLLPMTLAQYNALDGLEQVRLFFGANRIGMYMKDAFLYECRQIHSFYIELKTDGNSIEMWAHMDTDLLDPYLVKLV